MHYRQLHWLIIQLLILKKENDLLMARFVNSGRMKLLVFLASMVCNNNFSYLPDHSEIQSQWLENVQQGWKKEENTVGKK